MKAVLSGDSPFIGKSNIKAGGEIFPIFDRERTIVDSFRQLGIETAIKALKMAITLKGKDRISLTKLQDYAKKVRVKIDPYLLTVTT